MALTECVYSDGAIPPGRKYLLLMYSIHFVQHTLCTAYTAYSILCIQHTLHTVYTAYSIHCVQHTPKIVCLHFILMITS
jgi:hypothetical protein